MRSFSRAFRYRCRAGVAEGGSNLVRIIAPAGIGDWSWMWSKLWFVRDQITSVRIVDGAPRRTVPYVLACGIKDADYDTGPDAVCGTSYEIITVIEQAMGTNFAAKPTWKYILTMTEGNPLAYLPL